MLETEREIARAQAAAAGKPANVVERIADGKVEKFYQETRPDRAGLREGPREDGRAGRGRARAAREPSTCASRGSSWARASAAPPPGRAATPGERVSLRARMGSAPIYRRILLKLSGEALMGDQRFGIDPEVVARLADEVRDVHRLGVADRRSSSAAATSSGASPRPRRASSGWPADHMGLLATVINGLALQDALEKRGVTTRLMSAVEVRQIAEPFIRRRAIRHLEKGRVVLFVGGTGNPVLHDRLGRGAAGQRDPRGRAAEGDEGRRRLRRESRTGSRARSS